MRKSSWKYTPIFQSVSGSVIVSHLLFVVGDDATHEIGVRVSEGLHELGQLFLVELRHGAEHALPGAGAKLGVAHGLLRHANDFGCKKRRGGDDDGWK